MLFSGKDMGFRRWIIASLVTISLLSALITLTLFRRRFQVEPFPEVAAVRTSPPVPARGHVLLPGSELNPYVQYYLVNPRAGVQGWQPSQADIDDLEANLDQISSLKERGGNPSRRIESPDQYFRQYLGVLISDKKRIFVNATRRFMGDDESEWHRHLVVIVDGGKCYWRAYYDPITHQFSNLMINAVA